MKRLAFIVVALFAMAMAYAQPHADITDQPEKLGATHKYLLI